MTSSNVSNSGGSADLSSPTSAPAQNFLAEVMAALFMQWSWRHRMDRPHYWCAIGLIFGVQLLTEIFLSAVGHGRGAGFGALIFIGLLVLVVKCDIWRYRDAGFSPLWLIRSLRCWFSGLCRSCLLELSFSSLHWATPITTECGPWCSSRHR